MEQRHSVYLGLGSNLGDKEQTVRQAIKRIGELVGAVERQSALYVSAPWGFESPHTFVNAVVHVLTTLSPREVLHATQHIERELGKRPEHASEHRRRAAEVYHDRPIDIDILLYDDLHIDEPGLQIPHPRMGERDFVMVPLREIT